MKRSKLGLILLLAGMLTAGACEKSPSLQDAIQPPGQAAAPQSSSGEDEREQLRIEDQTNLINSAPVSEQEALAIAQKYETAAGLNWTAEYEANYEFDMGHEKQIFNAWIVTGTFSLGNKLVVYIDADTGKFIAASEIEAGSL